MTNVNFFSIGHNFKNLQKDLITRDICVKYQSSTTQYSKVISKVNVLKKYVKLSDQGHKVKNNRTQGKVFSQGILMWIMLIYLNSLFTQFQWPYWYRF